jgi:polysaccharide biosynthesis transport protein
MELRRYVDLLLNWWWLLVVGAALAAGAAYAVSRNLPPTYVTTATIFVNQSAAPNSITLSDAQLSQQLIKTYSHMASQPVVLEEVVRRLDLPIDAAALAPSIVVRPIRDTQLMEIEVQGQDPHRIRDIANVTAEVFIDQQRSYFPDDRASGALRVTQPALLPAQPIRPRVLLSTAVGGLVGSMLMGSVIALLGYLFNTVKTPDELEQAASLPTFGMVMRLNPREVDRNRILSLARPQSPAFEAYRRIRANMEFAGLGRRWSTLLVTSASSGEGKSTTAANLALVLAGAGRRVILVDADLRRPSLHRLFGLTNERGLTNLLLGDAVPLGECLQAGPVERLFVLSAGPVPSNPGEILASARMRAVVERLKAQGDVILFDAPGALAFTDPVVLAAQVDGVLLVVDARHTRADAVRRASEAIARTGTRLVGAVINNASGRGGGFAPARGYAPRPGGSGDVALPGASGSRQGA